ncbi:MAG: tetratricopeptide repeat-containing sensor histidine kinase, partial [Carboxylicivirga sp.]|nr:tetratricopeptide repeat-containing sensor histidine kinase [Carboxylicivirga sp.]
YTTKLDSALLYLNRSLSLAKELGDDQFIGRSLLNIGTVYWINGHNNLAIENYKNSVDFLDKVDDKRGMLYVLANIANIFKLKEEMKLALEYFNEAYDLANKLSDNVMLGNVLNNKAAVLSYLRRYDEALSVIDQAITAYKLTNNSKGLIQAHSNKADYLMAINKPDSAAHYIELIEKSYDLNEFPRAKINFLEAKADYSRYLKQHQQAKKYHLEALQIAIDYKLDNARLNMTNELAADARLLEKWKEASLYAEEVISLKDSIYDIKKVEELTFLQKAFELMKHEKEAQLLKAQQQLLKMELVNEKRSTAISVLITLFLLILVIIVFIAFLNYRKQKVALAHVNKQLLQRNNELLEANRIKNQLFSVLSHDLKSPLSSIISLASIMEQSPTISEKDDVKLVQAVAESSNLLMDFIDNTLLWFKKVHNNLGLKKQNISIAEVMKEVEVWFSSFSRVKNVNLKISVDDYRIQYDKNILMVLMRNIISNAIKFSHPNNSIEINWTKNAEGIIIMVKDKGVGMNAQQVEKLNSETGMHIFKQGSANEIGTGFGLYLCKELLESAGGALKIKSEEGKGTEISIFINVI